VQVFEEDKAMPRVPNADATDNRLEHQVIGNKTDTAVETATTTKSIMAYLKGVLGVTGDRADSAVTTASATDTLVGYVKGILSLLRNNRPVEVTGEADIDISEADYTAFQTLLTITPAAGENLIDCVIDLDFNKTTTGWDTVSTAADTLDIAVVSKVDDTNWRNLLNGTQITANGDGSLENSEDGVRLKVGMVGEDGEVAVKVKVNAERADAEIPYRVTYRGAAPTITPVAAA